MLSSGITKNWGETFTIDPWGNLTNRTVTKCSAEPLSVVALSNNQLSGFGYDADGNMTSNGGASYSYDAESRLKTTAGVTYTYDGDGERVKKSSGTEYWGPGPLLESDGSGNLQREFIFAGGKRIARRDISSGAVYYYISDRLGSADVVTTSTGAIQNESDYYPYGGERVYSQTLTNQNYKFTGKERDSESGLDNFGARFDSSNLGRFMTPDWAARPTAVPYAMFGDPQSLNLYSYVRNDPVSRADTDGHATNPTACSGDAWTCGQQAEADKKAPGGPGDGDAPQAQNQSCSGGHWCGAQKNPPGTCINATCGDTAPLTIMAALGHHGFPRALFRFLRSINPNAYRWLNNKFVTGQLEGAHYYDAAHRSYNEAVEDLLKLRTEEGQAEVAKDVAKAGRKVLDSDNPAIKNFLDNMKTREGMTGRQALEKALEGDPEAAGEFINGAIGEIVVDAAEAE